MVSRIEPDRYAGTGFAVNDTAPEINAMIFAAMMRKTPEERLMMGLDMMATARNLVLSSLAAEGTEADRKNRFYKRFYGVAGPW